MLIYLIGFMGSGKSTFGRLLAKELAIPFYDTDEIIVKEEGISINEIFLYSGEPYFRALESKLIRRFDSTSNGIVATGGGLPCSDGNMEYMRKSGVVVYLKCRKDILLKRLFKGRYKRPAIRDLSMEEIADKINDMLAQREGQYQEAHLLYKREAQRKEEVLELAKYLQMFI